MKLIGSIFIICASIFASFFYEKKQKNLIKCQSELISLVNYIKTQIEYFSKPINEIFNEYNSDNEFIKDVLLYKEKADFSILEQGVKKDVISLFKELGKGFKKEQISLCDYSLKVLNSSLDVLKSDYSKKCKIYRSIALFIGVCAIVLLI